jgi:PepSY-associated TM region
MNRFLYACHKWLSAAAFVQLAIWTVTGFLFAAIPQARLKSPGVEGAHRAPIEQAPEASVAQAMDAARPTSGAIDRVELRGTPAGPFYVVHGADAVVRVDARAGTLAPVTLAEAVAIAQRDQPAAPGVREAARVTEPVPLEYRGECESGDCTLPAFRVALADTAGTVVYVDASTGDVTTRRNDMWRTYDFLWSLHIMDYRGREDFNHWLIRCAAGLAVFTVASGIVLLAIRATRWTRKRLSGRDLTPRRP